MEDDSNEIRKDQDIERKDETMIQLYYTLKGKSALKKVDEVSIDPFDSPIEMR